RDGALVPGRGQLCESTREEVVAGGPRRVGPEASPGRRVPPPITGAVDQIVVDEGGHVHELDGDADGPGRLALRRRGEEDKQRAKAFAPGRERLLADGGGEPGVTANRLEQAVLDLLQVTVEPLGVVDR